MSIFDQAIKEGVEEGMYRAFAGKIEEVGDCYHDPEDRCVMRPKDGCACMYARWTRLPWYRRAFTAKPPKPSLESVQNAAFDLLIGEAISDARISKMKQAKAKARAARSAK